MLLESALDRVKNAYGFCGEGISQHVLVYPFIRTTGYKGEKVGEEGKKKRDKDRGARCADS